MKEVQQYYSIPEAANIIGLSRTQLFRRVKAGKAPAVRFGRNYLIPKEFIDKFPVKNGEIDQEVITAAVKKIVKEYGDVIKSLGDQ